MKVNVDKSNAVGKSMHNMTNQNSTTFDFGFVQPLMVDELEPDSNVELRIGQVLRLNPMVSPTFGDIKLKTYLNYVKAEDLYHPFPQMLTNQSYASVNGSYIPTSVPGISPFFIYSYVRLFSRVNIYKLSSYTSLTDYRKQFSNPTAVSISSQDWADAQTEFLANLDYSGIDTSSILTRYNPLVFVPDVNLAIDGADWVRGVVVNNVHYLVVGRYSQRAKNLYKIFIGSGFQFNESTKAKSLMPIFAFYKSWFDLFMPARTVTWTNTSAFSFLEYVEQYALPVFADWSSDIPAYQRFIDFLDDLSRTYYTLNVDFAAAHIDGQGNAIGTSVSNSFEYLDQRNNPTTVDIGSVNERPALYLQTNRYLGQTALNVLKAMDKRVNTQSVLGGRISELLRSIYGSNYQEYESNLIGTQILSANIDDVMSTASTDDAFLGQYAGKGLGSSPGKTFHFSAHDGTKFGYLVVLAAVVPETRMSQGMDMQLNHLKRNDFFDKNFDAITLLPTEKNFIYGCQDIVPDTFDSEDYTRGFGNIPNYIEYKTKKNILNGDMSMRSTRNSYLPFTLDRLLPFGDIYNTYGTSYQLVNVDLDWVINGEKWRYVGKYPILGNYDRIFENSGNEDIYTTDGNLEAFFDGNRIDDNFIVHNYLDYKKLSTGCEIADSWQTEAYGDHISVEEA